MEITSAESSGYDAQLQQLLPLDPVIAGHKKAPSGFNANLRGASLLDLVQMECLSMGRSVVEVLSPRGKGMLYFSGGQIVHAELGASQGDAAAVAILGWTSGSFEKIGGVPWPEAESITTVWQSLVMQAAQIRDESSDDVVVEDWNPVPEERAVEEGVTALFHLLPDGTVEADYGNPGEWPGVVAYAAGIIDLIGAIFNCGPMESADFDLRVGHLAVARDPAGQIHGTHSMKPLDSAQFHKSLAMGKGGGK